MREWFPFLIHFSSTFPQFSLHFSSILLHFPSTFPQSCSVFPSGADHRFRYSAIAVTHNFRGSPHVDSHDRTFQCVFQSVFILKKSVFILQKSVFILQTSVFILKTIAFYLVHEKMMILYAFYTKTSYHFQSVFIKMMTVYYNSRFWLKYMLISCTLNRISHKPWELYTKPHILQQPCVFTISQIRCVIWQLPNWRWALCGGRWPNDNPRRGYTEPDCESRRSLLPLGSTVVAGGEVLGFVSVYFFVLRVQVYCFVLLFTLWWWTMTDLIVLLYTVLSCCFTVSCLNWSIFQ